MSEDQIAEIKQGLKDIQEQLTELRVLVAGGYVKQEDCKKNCDKNDTAHTWIIGTLVTIGLAILGALINFAH